MERCLAQPRMGSGERALVLPQGGGGTDLADFLGEVLLSEDGGYSGEKVREMGGEEGEGMGIGKSKRTFPLYSWLLTCWNPL